MFTEAYTIYLIHQLRHLRARAEPCRIFNAASDKQIIFTGGATDAINLVAHGYLEPRLKPGDEIILSEMEHHSNIVPWHFLREQCGAVLKWVPVTDDGALDMEAYADMLGPRTEICVTHTNVQRAGHGDGCKNHYRPGACQKRSGFAGRMSGAVHLPTDVQALDVDFYVFSGHKFTDPAASAFYMLSRKCWRMRPYRGGGEMIREVSLDDVTYADPPHRFEAGTPPIVEAIGLGAALDYMMSIGWSSICAHEKALAAHAMDVVGSINRVRIFSTTPGQGRDCVIHG